MFILLEGKESIGHVVFDYMEVFKQVLLFDVNFSLGLAAWSCDHFENLFILFKGFLVVLVGQIYGGHEIKEGIFIQEHIFIFDSIKKGCVYVSFVGK